LDINWNQHRPGGTGKRVRISGYELWKIDNDDLIAESKGHFGAAEFSRTRKVIVDSRNGLQAAVSFATVRGPIMVAAS
jgi:hypothetical protein